MSGLGDLLGGADEEQGRAMGGARLDSQAKTEVHTKVRRAHARRSAFQVSMVAVAVVVLGAVGIYGIGRFGGQPPAADMPGVATPSPSPSVTPSSEPSLAAWPGFAGTVTTDPHLPQAQAITPEVWNEVAPGWSLVSYQERWLDAAGADFHGPQVIYLASPAGDLYELTAIDGSTVGVLAWTAGSTTAAVTVRPEGDMSYAGILNLVTGAVENIDGYAPYMWAMGFLDADGNPVYRGNDGTSAFVAIAPDGTQAPFEIPASEGAADLAKDATGLDNCNVEAPFDDSSTLVQCNDGDGWAQVVLTSVSNGTVTQVGQAQGVWTASPSRVGDAVVASAGEDSVFGCPTTYMAFTGTDGDPVPGVTDAVPPESNYFVPLGAYGDSFVWGATSACASDETPVVVVDSNMAARTYTVLVPYPSDRPAGEAPYQSVQGVAVGR